MKSLKQALNFINHESQCMAGLPANYNSMMLDNATNLEILVY